MLQRARGAGSVTPEGMAMIRAAQALAERERAERERRDAGDEIRSSGGGEGPPPDAGGVPAHRAGRFTTLAGGVRAGRGYTGSDVRVLPEVEVEAAVWLDADDARAAGEEAAAAERGGCWEVYFSDGETERFDRIWLATGSEFDVAKDPLLGPLMRERPVPVEGGLPVLERTLRWRRDTEVYVMGPFAALQLGPDALNLAGGKTGACRIDAALRRPFRSGAGAARTLEKVAVKLNKSGWSSVSLSFEDADAKEVRGHRGRVAR
jgi:hypothetical protein